MVPGCWETYPDTLTYRGKAVYSKEFEARGNIRLEFKGVSHTAEVYVDGEKVWTYNKSTDQNALNNGQWPFDAPFYIILNQSVGNGSWARPADESFTYETLFDWVRVYQKPEYTGIDDVLTDAEHTLVSNVNAVYDMQGRLVKDMKSGSLYIVDGKKVLAE